MMRTVTAKLANKAVLRNMCSHLCLMPMRHKAAPAMIRRHPVIPSAGVIVGVIGSGSGRDVVEGAALVAELGDRETDAVTDPVVTRAVVELCSVFVSCALEPLDTTTLDASVEVEDGYGEVERSVADPVVEGEALVAAASVESCLRDNVGLPVAAPRASRTEASGRWTFISRAFPLI